MILLQESSLRALPIELSPDLWTTVGFEPTTFCLPDRRSNQAELRAHIPIFYPILLNERSQYYMVYRQPYKQFYTLWKTDKLSITNGLLPATSHFKTT